MDAACYDVDPDRGRHRWSVTPAQRGERLEEHVAGAELEAVAAGGGVEAGLREGATGVDRAADALAEVAGRLQRHDSGVGVVLVLLLEGSLSSRRRWRPSGRSWSADALFRSAQRWARSFMAWRTTS